MKVKKKTLLKEVQNQKLLLKKRMDIYFDVKKKKALTKDEKKRLINLKFEEENLLNEQIRKTSAEDSVPFIKMYEEGICQVTDTFFGKIIGFEDVNYKMLDAERREEVRGRYEDLLNHFGNELRAEFMVKLEVLFSVRYIPVVSIVTARFPRSSSVSILSSSLT